MQSTIVVPRLAAAAFALGLGVAVFSGAAAASASPSSPDSSSVSASSDSQDNGESAAPAKESSSDDTSEAQSSDSGADADETTGEDADDAESDSDADADIEAPASQEDTSGSDYGPADSSDAPEAPETVSEEQPDAVTEDSAVPADVDSAVEDSPEPEVAAEIPEPVQNTSRSQTAVAPLKVLTDADMRRNVMLANLAVFFGFGAKEGDDVSGGIPALDNLIEQVFAGWRRVFNAPNVAPTATPDQIYQFDSGELIGDLDVSDRDGDRLTYTVVGGPAHGIVMLNSNGTYLYHADTDFMRTGGTDQFTVHVDDGSGRLATSIVVPVSVTPTLGFERGYNVDNAYTLAPFLRITDVGGDVNGYKGHPVGTYIDLGERLSWETREDVWVTQEVGITFSNGWRITTKVPPGAGSGHPQIRCTSSANHGGCSTGSNDFVQSQSVTLLYDQKVTQVLDANNAAQAAQAGDMLARYCANGKAASCTFKATNNERAVGNEHQFGASLSNPADATTNSTGSVTKSYTTTESDTVGVSVKASGGALTNLLSVINLEITANYQHTWTKSETFTQTVNFNVPAGKTQTWYVADPVWRVTGNFTVTLGNYTILINNAKFDSPRNDEQQPGAALVPRFTPFAG